MDHNDHLDLVRDGVASGEVWADLGAGSGAFTLALAEMVGAAGRIIAVDKDRRALHRLEAALTSSFPEVHLDVIVADFTQPLELPALDGILMANSLHYHRRKGPILKRLSGYLGPGGRLIVVEYDTDSGNMWVPHPFSFESWETLARESGFHNTRLLAVKPSRFLGRIFSAVSERPHETP